MIQIINISAIKKLLFYLFVILGVFACQQSSDTKLSTEDVYTKYCGNCHLAPNPENLPKSVWAEKVLPEMAARLGLQINNYNPYRNYSMEENLHRRLSKAYPENPTIDSSTWNRIYDYVLSLAPDSIPIDSTRNKRNQSTQTFLPQLISTDPSPISYITSLDFDSTTNQFLICGGDGSLSYWPNDNVNGSNSEVSNIPNLDIKSPLISYKKEKENTFITEIGFMDPSDKPLGTMYRVNNEMIDTIALKLHRPVFTEIIDLNNDGASEILICEFGNLTGQLSLLKLDHSATKVQYKKEVLLPLPGTIKLEVADMNGDGLKDIIVLASQGDEGIYILYQKNDLNFEIEHPVKLPPEFGSSWFEMLDYNKDGFLDIVLVNGDNADLSIFPKPYHGIRLFINDGSNQFNEKWFYPIYGATIVKAADYDLDGDFDFVVTSFFPDFEYNELESVIYLENKNPEKYEFSTAVFPEAKAGRWMVMKNGDFDQDGDIDIVLGSFMLPVNMKYMDIMNYWREKKSDLLLLENATIN